MPHPLATVFPGTGHVDLALRYDPLPLRVAAPLWVGNRGEEYELVEIIQTSPDGKVDSGTVSAPPKQWSGTGFRCDVAGIYRVEVKEAGTGTILAEGTFTVTNEPAATFAP